MSILKALERKQAEQNGGPPDEKPSNVVQFDKQSAAAKRKNPADLFADNNLKIGAPSSSAFKEQNGLQVGKTLSDLKPVESAGANLNAVASTRPAVNLAPEFISWKVDAERVEPRLVAISTPNSKYCEEYRSLRTHVLHKSRKQRLQSIVIAGVNPGEGKSVTALNFSWLLAQTDGVRALLIDSDLRMPSLSKYLGIQAKNGLSEILSGKATLRESIIKLEPAGLHLLPGGEARTDVAELISGPRFSEILREAKDMFDYVIIDAPPLAIFTDANVLINHADGALLVVRADHSRYETVDRVLETLPRERMLGVVLNESKDSLTNNNYEYGYYKNV